MYDPSVIFNNRTILTTPSESGYTRVKQKIEATLEADIAAFLANGGEITKYDKEIEIQNKQASASNASSEVNE